MYHYYVSYQYSQGYGSCESRIDKKIKTIEQIRAIEKSIENDKNITGVCINNFILLKRGYGKCKN